MKKPDPMSDKPVIIIGAGCAGLSAAHELVNSGVQPIVLEKADTVGGLARTERYKGYSFDIGGHRFYTKMDNINRLWREMLGEDFLTVPRLSRIYYHDRFFNYPISLANALLNLGITESALIMLSYLKSQIRPHHKEETFEQWISNRFGQRLYETFFKTYTEKVWGIPCHMIRADWAAQRIKGLSFFSAVANALFGKQNAKSLINEFNYPVSGPGMMWECFQAAIEGGGGQVRLGSEIVSIAHRDGLLRTVRCSTGDQTEEIPVRHVISSMPINLLVAQLAPKPPDEVLVAAGKLSYRAFSLIGLIVDKQKLFPDQWIYVHSPDVRVGRIQNFKNWSAAMVPDDQKTSLGMEYFCSEGDDIWTMSDADIISLATRELSMLGLADVDDVIDGYVVRQPHAYPIYDDGYSDNLKLIRDYLETFDNLQVVGRNGMHRYNNMDHSMLTGKLAAQNFLGSRHNLWQVNDDWVYLEEDKKASAAQRHLESILIAGFARMDKLAFGSAVGLSSGLLIFLATIWVIVKGGVVVGPTLQLLSQYFAGYTVSIEGAFIAFSYCFFWGFLFGWLFAYLRNFFLAYYIYRSKRASEQLTVMDFFDHH